MNRTATKKGFICAAVGVLASAVAGAAVAPISGRGEIRVSGARVVREAPAGSPFVHYRVAPLGGATNRTLRTLTLPRLVLSTAAVPDPANLAVRGSSGLAPLVPNKDFGSFGYFAFAEPMTRRGVVCGWLTDRKANGFLRARVVEGQVTVMPELQYGKCLVAAGSTLPEEVFVVGAFDDCRLGLEAFAAEIAREHAIRLKPQIAGYCTWYAEEPYGWGGDEASTRQFVDLASKMGLGKWGFSFFQIDDFWQDGETSNGPAKTFTRVRPDGPYKSGMQATFDAIAARGFRPGVWFMPFVGTHDGAWWRDKQDLFLKGPDGRPYETTWGGTVLDMTKPESRAYLADVTRRICRDWHCKYIKYDGMWTALGCRLGAGGRDGTAPDDFGEQAFHDPTLTGVDAYRLGVRTLREAAGDDVFVLACNLAQSTRGMGPSYGLVDAMRVGGDNGPWERRWWIGFEPATSAYFLNGRVWYNDPDPVYVRDSREAGKARLTASWTSLAGFFYNFSDWLGNLSPARLDVLKRTMAPHRSLNVRPVEYFEKSLPNVWHLSERGCDVFSICNFKTNGALRVDYAMDYVGLDASKTYAAFDFWNDRFLEPVRGRFAFDVPTCDCRVVALRAFDGTRPVVVSTSRHVASPVFDVVEERWDAASRTLAGRATVVAGEPYELRLAVPDGFVCTAEGGAAVEQSGNRLRVRYQNPPADLRWKLSFSSGAPVVAGGSSQKLDDAYESDRDVPVYVDVAWLPDATMFLPEPPAWSSPLFIGDQAGYIWGKSLRDTVRGRLAVENGVFTVKDVIKRFEKPFGMEVTPERTPAIYKVLSRGLMTARRASNKPKDAYKRKRPYCYYGEGTLIPKDEEVLRENGSYPSGHALRAWCMALLMAELNPKVQDAVLKFGHEYGESRIIAGYHWRSDVEAGRHAASAAFARLHASKEFLADMAVAREELARLSEK